MDLHLKRRVATQWGLRDEHWTRLTYGVERVVAVPRDDSLTTESLAGARAVGCLSELGSLAEAAYCDYFEATRCNGINRHNEKSNVISEGTNPPSISSILPICYLLSGEHHGYLY